MAKRYTSLTLNRLYAIAEALNHRLAGSLEESHLKADDYRAAKQWADDKIAKKAKVRQD